MLHVNPPDVEEKHSSYGKKHSLHGKAQVTMNE